MESSVSTRANLGARPATADAARESRPDDARREMAPGDSGSTPTLWRAAAFLLAFASGAAALYAIQYGVRLAANRDSSRDDQRSVVGNSRLAAPLPADADAMASTSRHEVDQAAASPVSPPHAVSPPEGKPEVAANAAAMAKGRVEDSEPLKVVGVTEPAPGRYAMLPLATSQAVAFIDVKSGDRIKKGYQVFSHWESPDRLQAVKIEVEKTRRMLDMAKTRSAAAEQSLARLNKLQGRGATPQEIEDAQSGATLRVHELNAAELAVSEAERRYTGLEFEFNQAFVTSPIDGVVATVDLALGERRQIGSTFRGVTVLDARVLNCRCLLAPDQLSRLERADYNRVAASTAKAGDAAKGAAASPEIVLESQGREYRATLAAVGAVADATTGRIPVLLEVPNPNETLRCGIQVMVLLRCPLT